MSFKEKFTKLFVDVDAADRKTVSEAFNEALADLDSSTSTNSFIDVPTSNGTMLSIEPGVEVGAAVTMPDAEGNIVPAEDGEHELEDGRIIVTVGGVIDDVLTPTGETVEVSEEEMSDIAPKADAPSPKSVIERTEVEKKFEAEVEEVEEVAEPAIESASKEDFDALKNEFAAYKVEAENKLDKVLEAVEVLMDFSAVQPTEKPKTAGMTMSRIVEFKKQLRKR